MAVILLARLFSPQMSQLTSTVSGTLTRASSSNSSPASLRGPFSHNWVQPVYASSNSRGSVSQDLHFIVCLRVACKSGKRLLGRIRVQIVWKLEAQLGQLLIKSLAERRSKPFSRT